jgi:CubicO group peptidase (beta-lactamase class C family)
MSGMHRVRIASLSLLSGLCLAAASPPPASPPESLDALLHRRAEAFVAALNAQSDQAMGAFARDHLESRLAREGLTARFVATMREDVAEMGRVEKHTARILQDGKLLFVYTQRAASGAWLNYQFRVLPDDGNRLQLVFRATAVEPMERPSTPLASRESQEWLRKFLTALEKQQPFSGVAFVRTAGKDVYSLAEGLADASSRTPITPASRLNMASGSKMFTAVAILQLAQAGKLGLSDPLIKFLPSFRNQEFARRATIQQLLTHTAGAGDYWDAAYEKHWGSITETSQMLPFVLNHLGDSPAGTFAYSNSGFILLGLVVEAVSGMSYSDYVQKHIFAPAGMTATGYPLRSRHDKNVALPYEPAMSAGAVKPGVYLPAELGERGTAAGGASTTGEDMLRFAAALQDGRLLDKAHHELMLQPREPFAGKDSWYGDGVIIEKKRGVLSYGHGGMGPGTQFEFKIYPGLDTAMVVMSNYNTIAAPEIASALDDLIRNGKPAKP